MLTESEFIKAFDEVTADVHPVFLEELWEVFCGVTEIRQIPQIGEDGLKVFHTDVKEIKSIVNFILGK